MVDPEKLKQFIDITGANEETGKFFLGAARNEVDGAVNAFFEADGMIPAGSVHPTTGAVPASTSSRAPAPVPAAAVPSRGGAGPSVPAPARSRRAPTGGIATLASLGGNDEDDDESGKNYYAGGEKSGQMIQDPRDQNNNSNSNPGDGNDRRLADAILERARQRAGAMDDADRERFSENQRFTGAGYRLGDEAAAAANNGTPAAPSVVGRRNVTRTITFYDNGFVVDDGELRGYEDPANAAFLADVNKGVVPREMEAPGVGDVSITLMDKKNEKYEPPKRRLVPFSGGGQTLSSAAAPTSTTAAAAPASLDAAVATLSVDDSLPVAQVQVRLSDGTRLRARLNETHTVADLRAFVQAARPGTQTFALATTFPRKELADDAQTIKEAGLKGAVVVQTLK